jgi:hypothetical protein
MRFKSTIRLPSWVKLTRFRRSEDASVAIEFGFIAPAFFLLFFTFVETAVMMFTEYAMTAAVSESAREIRTGQAQSKTWSSTELIVKTCGIAKLIPNCWGNLKVFVDASATFENITPPPSTEVGLDDGGVVQNTRFVCGEPQQVVAVIVTYDHKFIFPVMRFFANTGDSRIRRLRATALFRNEPYIRTSSCSTVPSTFPTL